MKPTTLLRKISVAGMLASCIFLVNCGRAKDEAKEKLQQKLAMENASPVCSDQTMQLLRQRSTLFTSIREVLAGPVDDAQKIKLQTFIDEVYAKSNLVKENVRLNKVAGFPATECVFKENDSEIKYQLGVIKTEDLTLAKKVFAVTEKQNQIMLNTRPEWKAGDKVKVSADLAQLLSNENFVNGKRVIYKGKVANGGADFTLLKKDLSASLCITSVVDGQQVSADEESEIGNITKRLDDKLRIVQDLTLLFPSLSGKRSLLISCTLADASDLNDAMVDTFGALLTKQEPAK